MNKQQIFDDFDGKISKTAIKQLNGEWRILGKNVEIEYVGNDSWDVYVHDLDMPTGQVDMQRVNGVLGKFTALNHRVVKLNGEGYVQGSLDEIKPVVLSNLAYFGIRKKRKVSPEQLKQMKANLENKQ